MQGLILYNLSHIYSPFYLWLFFQVGSPPALYPGLPWTVCSFLCHLNIWDYRHEPPHLAQDLLFKSTNPIKEEVTNDMESLRKKKETETQNTVEGHSIRLDHLEDRVSELKDKIEIQGKTEELLVKQLYKGKMQEFTDSIKRPNLRIMGIEEGEEVQAKGICNLFNKIITENFPNLEKVMPI
jgi:hypothetical protein